jgi:outer membrane protein assembly factor BamB
LGKVIPNNDANSFIKLKASCGGGVSFAGRFTPDNSVILSLGDTDLGSSGPLLLPGNLLIGGGKQGRAYVLDASTMKLSQNPREADGFQGFQAFVNTYYDNSAANVCSVNAVKYCRETIAQTKSGIPDHRTAIGDSMKTPGCFLDHACYQLDQGFGPNIHAGFVYWESTDPQTGLLYALAEKEYLRAFRYHRNTGHVDEVPAMTNQNIRVPNGMPGGALSISANGQQNGIVWTSLYTEDAIFYAHPGSLVAVDALTLKQLWREDNIQYFAKFNPPTVADGTVFLATWGVVPGAKFPTDPKDQVQVTAKVIAYGLK